MIQILIQYGLAAVIGGLAGAGGGYFAWDIDKRRDLRARRRALIDLWRSELLPAMSLKGHDVVRPEGHAIVKLPSYASLRGHLSETVRTDLDGRSGTPFGGQEIQVNLESNGELRRQLMTEIDRIERKWGLV